MNIVNLPSTSYVHITLSGTSVTMYDNAGTNQPKTSPVDLTATTEWTVDGELRPPFARPARPSRDHRLGEVPMFATGSIHSSDLKRRKAGERLAVVKEWPSLKGRDLLGISSEAELYEAIGESTGESQSDLKLHVRSWMRGYFLRIGSSLTELPAVVGASDEALLIQPAQREHIPLLAYSLLRSLAEGPVKISTIYGRDNEAAVTFLLTRGLAEIQRKLLLATSAGSEIGEILS